MQPTRRHLLQAAAAFCAAPGITFANVQSERRFVFVIQRGAADGLDTVVPTADPGYARLRRELALDAAQTIRVDASFGLHPALVETGRMVAAGEALCVHAVASAYRDRSHFDGQNVLETGGSAPYAQRDGWLNRLAGLLPPAAGGGGRAIAFAPTLPPALRGPVDVASFAPSTLPRPSDDLLAHVTRLYQGDAQLHGLWSAALATRGMAGDDAAGPKPAELGRLAAGFLARADGPRIAMLETGGWDTHSNQRARLAAQLKALDALLGALRDGLGDAWRQTVVLVATEFGRTAAANGTGGTDHGTASAALVAGGAVAGGRVVADWPGLATADLHEGRDLKPTAGLEALVAQLAAECFDLDPERAARALFPALALARTPRAAARYLRA